MPEGVSAILGGTFPIFGTMVIPLQEIPPSLDSGYRSVKHSPLP